GKVRCSVSSNKIDMLCMSSHKLYGPKGIGALYVRRKNRRIQIAPLIHGGGQENGMRAGTLNVPAIVGFGMAAEIARRELAEESSRLAQLRERLEMSIINLPATFVNGQLGPRMPNVSNITFRHTKASEIMMAVPDIALASGSASVSGTRDPSHVLLAMGLSAEDAHSSIRFSLGRFNNADEIDRCIAQVAGAVTRLRTNSPVWQLYQSGAIE